MTMYVVYEGQSLGRYAVRGYWIIPALGAVLCPEPLCEDVPFAEARDAIPEGLVCIARDETDHPSVVETWK